MLFASSLACVAGGIITSAGIEAEQLRICTENGEKMI